MSRKQEIVIKLAEIKKKYEECPELVKGIMRESTERVIEMLEFELSSLEEKEC